MTVLRGSHPSEAREVGVHPAIRPSAFHPATWLGGVHPKERSGHQAFHLATWLGTGPGRHSVSSGRRVRVNSATRSPICPLVGHSPNLHPSSRGAPEGTQHAAWMFSLAL